MSLAGQRHSPSHDTTKTISTTGLTLEAILQNQTQPPFSFREFADYLEQTYCAENLTFYLAVNEYCDLVRRFFGSVPDSLEHTVQLDNGEIFDFSHNPIALTDHELDQCQTLQRKFNAILDRFIRTNATHQINLPHELRTRLLDIGTESFHPAALKPAQVAIVELMRISAFIPFATHPDRLLSHPNPVSRSPESTEPDVTDSPPSDASLLKRLASSLRFRGRSQSPPRPPTWRQINIANTQLFMQPKEKGAVSPTGQQSESVLKDASASNTNAARAPNASSMSSTSEVPIHITTGQP